jgi:putative phosphoesterase
LFAAIENEPTAEIVYFLGDGLNETEEAVSVFKDKKFFILVRGNCDFGGNIPYCDIRSIENCKIYASHGAEENVNLSYVGIKRAAIENNCNIALFGHTHEKYYSYEDGLHLFNPGSIKDGNYGIIDILDNGIMCFHKNLLNIK